MILRRLIPFISLLLVACSPSAVPPQEGEVSIAYLKSLCEGDHYRITDNYTIRGVVVATDWLGELNKSAIVVDATGGLEFAIDSRNISEQLPVFSEVIILCNGLMLARVGSKIELGMPPTGNFLLDNIDAEHISRYIRIVAQGERPTPVTKRFSEIDASDISNVVRFEGVRITPEEQGLEWCDKVDGSPVATIRTLVDSNGDTLPVHLLPTCIYAEEKMPTNEISVEGVIDYSGNRYFLRIVNRAIE